MRLQARILSGIAALGIGAGFTATAASVLASHKPGAASAALQPHTQSIVRSEPNSFVETSVTTPLRRPLTDSFELEPGSSYRLELKPIPLPPAKLTTRVRSSVMGVNRDSTTVSYSLGSNRRSDTWENATPDDVRIVMQLGSDVVLCERAPDIAPYCFVDGEAASSRDSLQHEMAPETPMDQAPLFGSSDAFDGRTETSSGGGELSPSTRTLLGHPATCITTRSDGVESESCFTSNFEIIYQRFVGPGVSFEVETIGYSTDVSAADLEPPFRLVDAAAVSERWSNQILLLSAP